MNSYEKLKSELGYTNLKLKASESELIALRREVQFAQEKMHAEFLRAEGLQMEKVGLEKTVLRLATRYLA